MTARKHPWRYWTPEDTAVVRAEYGKVPARTIAARLGRTTASVQLYARSLGLRSQLTRGSWLPNAHRWTPEVDSLIAALNGAGATDAEIARRLPGVSPDSVRFRRRAVLKLKPRRLTVNYGLPPIKGRNLLSNVLALLNGPMSGQELVELQGRSGLCKTSTRSAMKRLRSRGFVSSVKSGRNAFYALTPHALELIAAAGKGAADGRP